MSTRGRFSAFWAPMLMAAALIGAGAMMAAPTHAAPPGNTPVPAPAAAPVAPAPLPPIPAPMNVPRPAVATDQPYSPQPILPGGIVIPLYQPGSKYLDMQRVNQAERYTMHPDVPGRIRAVVGVHNPSIEVHLVDPLLNTGTTIILAAGGGANSLNVGTESADFVPFLYNYGINTVILRNRLPVDGYDRQTQAVGDALQAIRMVRAYAKNWRMDPNKIGIMGFSAGAELAAPAALRFGEWDEANKEASDPFANITSRPDFTVLVYPGPVFNANSVIPARMPPSFVVCAGVGDAQHAAWGNEWFTAMLAASVPNIEMHIYANGFHPGTNNATGGLTDRNGLNFGTWHLRLIDWMRELGFTQKPGVVTKAAQDSQNFTPRGAGRGAGGAAGGRRGRGGARGVDPAVPATTPAPPVQQ